MRQTVNNISPVSGRTFDSADRYKLDQVWNHLQTGDASKGESSGKETAGDFQKKVEVWKKIVGTNVPGTDASARHNLDNEITCFYIQVG